MVGSCYLNMKTKNKTQTFLVISFLISWVVWGAMIFIPIPENLFIPLLFLGAFGPTLAAIFLIHSTGKAEEKRNFWNRVINFRRIDWKWLLLILSIFPAILMMGYSVLFLLGEKMPDFTAYFSGLTNLKSVAVFLVFMLLGGPLAEELGWRGYLQDPLQEKWGRFKGSIILGIIWLLWHLPLFFIEGSSQHQKGFGIAFWSWSLQLMVLSIIFTWIYNHTQKSILAAVLLHFMANFSYPLNLDAKGEIVFSMVRLLVILPILFYWYKTSAAAKRGIPASVSISRNLNSV